MYMVGQCLMTVGTLCLVEDSGNNAHKGNKENREQTRGTKNKTKGRDAYRAALAVRDVVCGMWSGMCSGTCSAMRGGETVRNNPHQQSKSPLRTPRPPRFFAPVHPQTRR